MCVLSYESSSAINLNIPISMIKASLMFSAILWPKSAATCSRIQLKFLEKQSRYFNRKQLEHHKRMSRAVNFRDHLSRAYDRILKLVCKWDGQIDGRAACRSAFPTDNSRRSDSRGRLVRSEGRARIMSMWATVRLFRAFTIQFIHAGRVLWKPELVRRNHPRGNTIASIGDTTIYNVPIK